jgi:hypothetical protein
MDNINKTINYIDMLKPNQLVEKVNLITDLNQQIDKEKSIYNNYLEHIDNDNDNIILHKKYNKKTIDELQELFNNENNINDMIKIYQTLCFKINDISNSLFNQVLD